MSNHFLSAMAVQDLDEIVSYLIEKSPGIAFTFLDSLEKTIEMLANHPMMGHKREEITEHPIRFWTFKWHYLISYKSSTPIEIVRILSGCRDIAKLLLQEENVKH